MKIMAGFFQKKFSPIKIIFTLAENIHALLHTKYKALAFLVRENW